MPTLEDFRSIIDTFSCDPDTGVVYRTLAFMGFPHYRVGTDGSVWSNRVYGSRLKRIGQWWTMKPKRRKGDDHLYVDLFRHTGTPERFYVHLLVLLAFVGPCQEGMICRHWNDVPSDNRVENLLWGTHRDNTQDAIRNDKCSHGDRHYNARFSNAQILEIRALAGQGMRYRLIGERFGCGRHYVAKIACREIWKHVT